MSNEDTVKIDKNGIVYPINEGTVFLSNKIDNKVHIIEIYVSNNETRMYTSQRNGIINRNYYKVFVDPGHGGSDNGASSFSNLEDNLSLQIAKSLESKLKQKGIQVKMSRTSDEFISLGERARLANAYGADAFVSIHLNSSSNEGASGIETYYHTQKNEHSKYSKGIQNNAIRYTNSKDRGIKSANFVVLRETNMASSLFESGFISNLQESENLSNPVYQDKLASAIANGLETYLKENIKLNLVGQLPEENTSPDDIIKNGVVAASNLNVRSGYGTNYSVVGSLVKGSKVNIVESKNGWYKIKYNSGYGCISASYIKDKWSENPSENIHNNPPVNNKVKNGTVMVSSLSIRSGYGTRYPKIGSLSKGSKVEIIESKNGWHKVKYKNTYGYVYEKYVIML